MAGENAPDWQKHEFLIFHPPANPEAPKWFYAQYTWLTMGIMLTLVIVAMIQGRKQVPGKLQGAFEFAYEWLREAVISVMGERGLPYFPFFISFFLFILFSNLLGLVPGMASGTAGLDTTLALALVVFSMIHLLGMFKKGFFSYWGHFFNILDSSKEKGIMKILIGVLQYILLPLIELIGEAARPLSLSMRLFGNIYAKDVLLAVLAYMLVDYVSQGLSGGGVFAWSMTVVPLVLRPAILVLGVLVSLIQAVVFTALAMVYINGAIDTHDEHDEHHEHQEQGNHAPEAV